MRVLMKNDKKLMCLAMFVFVTTGCGVCHKNIVKNTVDNCLLVEDVETHQERVIELSKTRLNKYVLEHTCAGDTVKIKAPYYEKHFVFGPDSEVAVYFDSDSINNRARKKELELKKQQMFKNNTR